MSSALIAFIGILYALISIDQFYKSNPAMGIVFAAYAAGNAGLWLAAK